MERNWPTALLLAATGSAWLVFIFPSFSGRGRGRFIDEPGIPTDLVVVVQMRQVPSSLPWQNRNINSCGERAVMGRGSLFTILTSATTHRWSHTRPNGTMLRKKALESSKSDSPQPFMLWRTLILVASSVLPLLNLWVYQDRGVEHLDKLWK